MVARLRKLALGFAKSKDLHVLVRRPDCQSNIKTFTPRQMPVPTALESRRLEDFAACRRIHRPMNFRVAQYGKREFRPVWYLNASLETKETSS